MNTNSIGQAIRKYRHEKQLSQDDLSKLSGIPYNTIVKLEKKDRPANPTVGTLLQLTKTLGVSIEALVSNKSEPGNGD